MKVVIALDKREGEGVGQVLLHHLHPHTLHPLLLGGASTAVEHHQESLTGLIPPPNHRMSPLKVHQLEINR